MITGSYHRARDLVAFPNRRHVESRKRRTTKKPITGRNERSHNEIDLFFFFFFFFFSSLPYHRYHIDFLSDTNNHMTELFFFSFSLWSLSPTTSSEIQPPATFPNKYKTHTQRKRRLSPLSCQSRLPCWISLKTMKKMEGIS